MKFKLKVLVAGLLLGAVMMFTGGVRNGLPYHSQVSVTYTAASANIKIRPGWRSSYGDFYAMASTAGLCTLAIYHPDGDSTVVVVNVGVGDQRIEFFGPHFDSVRVVTAAATAITSVLYND